MADLGAAVMADGSRIDSKIPFRDRLPLGRDVKFPPAGSVPLLFARYREKARLQCGANPTYMANHMRRKANGLIKAWILHVFSNCLAKKERCYACESRYF